MRQAQLVLTLLLALPWVSLSHAAQVMEATSDQVDFESGLSEQNIPLGWQSHIKDGFQLSYDAGFELDSRSLKMDGQVGGKAVMIFQKRTTKQPIDARFVLTGRLKTSHLRGETALYLRVFSEGQMIHQDDMRAYALSGSQNWTEVSIRSPRLTAVTAIELGVLAMGEGVVWLDDLSMKQQTGEQVSPAVQQYAETSFELIRADSMYPINESVKNSYFDSLKGAQEVADAHGSVVQLLKEMGDDHASFMPATVVNEKAHTKMKSKQTSQPQDDVPSAEHQLTGLGYIKIPGFNKTTGDAKAYLQAAHDLYTQHLDSSRCGWIVDLRGNSGGSMWPMLAAVAPLLDQEVVGYMLDSKGAEWPWRINDQHVMLGDQIKQALGHDLAWVNQKVKAANKSQQVVVLLDRNTASSAEAVAMAFKGQEHVLFSGAKSAGLTTGISQVQLPDGSLVRLSIAEFADRNKQTHPSGLLPDLALDDGQDALDEAVHHLSNQASCQLVIP